MSRFVAVFHHWFMDSNGFTVEEIDAANEVEAQEKADALAFRQNEPFNRTAVHVLAIDEANVLRGRRLSWRERLTGRQALRTSDGGKDV